MAKKKSIKELAKEQPAYIQWLQKGGYIAGLLGFHRIVAESIPGSPALVAWEKIVNGKSVVIALHYRAREMKSKRSDSPLDFEYALGIEADY